MAAKKDEDKEFRTRALELVRHVLIGNPLKRFFSAIFFAGVTLIGGEGIWYLVTEYFLAEYGSVVGTTDPQAVDDPNWLTVRNSGLLLCGVGIALHLILFALEQAAAQRKTNDQIKNSKAELIGKLRDIAKGFEDENVIRSPGFMSDDLRQAKCLANKIKASLSNDTVADPIFAIISDPKIDSTGKNPYLNVSSRDLRSFADRLESSQGGKRT